MTGHPKNSEFELRLWALHPGAYICCLFGSETEHRALLAPFMRHGLERYEKVLYIFDAHTAEQILAYLSADGVQVSPFLQNGQLKILDTDASYTRNGVFDPEGMIALLRSETQRAIEEGYSGNAFRSSAAIRPTRSSVKPKGARTRFRWPNRCGRT